MKRLILFLLISLLLAGITSISCSQPQGKIRVATTAAFPPFTTLDQDNIVGFDINLMNLIAEKENLQVEFVKVSRQELLDGMAQGLFDAAVAGLTITEARQKDMLFSEPYFTTGQVVMVFIENNTITGKDSLAGKTVGVETASTSASAVAEMPGLIVKHYDYSSAAVNDLLNKNIDAVVIDGIVAAAYVANYPGQLKIVGEPFTLENYGIAVAKNKPELLEKINAGLSALKAGGQLDEITEKWIPQ